MRPQFLVSVRNEEEALAAWRGGADVIDLKEPNRGSLGMVDEQSIGKIVARVRAADEHLPLSVALGEFNEWKDAAEFPRLPAEVGYLKLGLSGSVNDRDWPKGWQAVRKGFSASLGPAVNWVAVIYADWKAALAPPPEAVIQAARESACGVVLVDTFFKQGRSLTQVIPPRELSQIAHEVHQAGLPLALAGSLRPADLPLLVPLSPNVLAIRSAACRDGVRGGIVCETAVRQFREAIATVFNPENAPP